MYLVHAVRLGEAAGPSVEGGGRGVQREVQREGLARPEADAGEVRGQWREEDAEAGEHDENGREVRRKRRREAIDEHPGTEPSRVEPGRSEREGGAADVEPRRLADAAAEPRGARFRHCPGVRWKRSRGQRETGGGARGAHEQERALGGDRIVPQRHDCGNDESQPETGRPADSLILVQSGDDRRPPVLGLAGDREQGEHWDGGREPEPKRRVGGDDEGNALQGRDDERRGGRDDERRENERSTLPRPVRQIAEDEGAGNADERRRREEHTEHERPTAQFDDVQGNDERRAAERHGGEPPREQPASAHGVVT